MIEAVGLTARTSTHVQELGWGAAIEGRCGGLAFGALTIAALCLAETPRWLAGKRTLSLRA
jgi:hypothetical protein